MINKEEEENIQSSLAFAIGASLNTEIKFVVNCRVRVKVKKREDPFRQVILCLGKEDIYFFDDELKTVKFKFSYKNVNDIIVEKLNLSSVMINLNEVNIKGKNVPHIYITIPDRDHFLSLFKCYFVIYFADQYSKIKDLHVAEKSIIVFENETSTLDKYKCIYHFPPETYRALKYKNYFFFLPPIFKEDDMFNYKFTILNPYASKIREEVKINNMNSVSMYDSDLDETMNKRKEKNNKKIKLNHHKDNLNELKCDFKINMKLERNGNTLNNKNLYYMDFYTSNEFIMFINKTYGNSAQIVISKDCFYLKKYNLAEDYSNWTGWQIEALMTYPKKKKIVFITLRRKFIPPFFETFSDFTFICIIDLSALNINQLIKFRDLENFELNKYIETLIDSLYPESVLNYRDFIPVLETKFDSLCLDYDTFNFYTETLKIYGIQTFKLALKFIFKMLDFIVKDSTLEELEITIGSMKKKDNVLLAHVKNFRKFHSLFIKKILKFINSDKKMKDDPHMPKDLEQLKRFYENLNLKEIFLDFKVYLTDFFNDNKHLFPNNEDTMHKQRLIVRNWEEKVGNFLYFCLDGSICGNLFNIEFIIKIMKLNKKIRTEFREPMLSIVCNKFEEDQNSNSIADIVSIRKNEYNEKFLCKILKFGNFKDFFGFLNFKLQNEFLVYLIEEKWSYEILEAIHVHLTTYIENEEELDVKEYMKNFSDIKKGLVIIYLNDSLSPKISVLTAKILVVLCSYDDSGSSVEALINLDTISAIARNILSYDYSLLQINFLLLYVLSDKIKSLKLTELVAEEKLLLNSLSTMIINAKFYDNPMYVLEILIKILFNLIASDYTIIQKKLLEQINSDTMNNVVINFLSEFLVNKKANIKEDYKSFIKHCKIEEKVYRFYSCVIKKNPEMKNYLMNEINLFKVLGEKDIFKDLLSVYNQYKNIFNYNKFALSGKTHTDSPMLTEFYEFLKVLYRLFQFTYFLYENYKIELCNVIENEEYLRDFVVLFENIYLESISEENGIIKQELINIEIGGKANQRSEFKDFNSSIFSLHLLISVREENDII